MIDSLKREVDQFKRELDSVGYYCGKLQDVNVQLFAIGVQLYEVGGTNYDKDQSVNGNPNKTPKLNLMMEEEKLIKEASEWENKINRCRHQLKKCSVSTKDILIARHICKVRWSEIEVTYNYSRNTLKYQIEEELANILFSPPAKK